MPENGTKASRSVKRKKKIHGSYDACGAGFPACHVFISRIGRLESLPHKIECLSKLDPGNVS